MSENPLLPHRKLQELYRLMERTRTLERKHKHSPAAREAMLAATAIHLEPGDLVCAPVGDLTPNQLAPVSTSSDYTPKSSRLVLAAATARGLQASETKGLLIAYASAGTLEPGWDEALAWAQAERLPFVFAVADATNGKSATKSLSWTNVNRVASKLMLPTLSVDGEDAVAVYRVMQEASLRARTAAGPCILWARLTPASNPLPNAARPLARLKRYMKARKIPLS